MRPRNPTHQPHDRYPCCICNGNHCCCQCPTEVRSPDNSTNGPEHLFTGTDPGNGVHHLVTVWRDGTATIAYREHSGATWGPPHPLDREEV